MTFATAMQQTSPRAQFAGLAQRRALGGALPPRGPMGYRGQIAPSMHW